MACRGIGCCDGWMPEHRIAPAGGSAGAERQVRAVSAGRGKLLPVADHAQWHTGPPENVPREVRRTGTLLSHDLEDCAIGFLSRPCR